MKSTSQPENRNEISEAVECEVRFAADDEGALEGIACRFNTLDSYRTTFDQRAFPWDGKSIPLLWSHRADEVVGSVRSIVSDAEGLKIKGRLNLAVGRAREVRAMLAAGDISGLSVGFNRIKDEAGSGGIRHITEARLREVSFVAIPSVPGSGVTSIRHPKIGRESAAVFLHALNEAARALKGN